MASAFLKAARWPTTIPVGKTAAEDSSRDGAATWVQFSGDVNPKLDMARDRELRLVRVMFSVKLKKL